MKNWLWRIPVGLVLLVVVQRTVRRLSRRAMHVLAMTELAAAPAGHLTQPFGEYDISALGLVCQQHNLEFRSCPLDSDESHGPCRAAQLPRNASRSSDHPYASGKIRRPAKGPG